MARLDGLDQSLKSLVESAEGSEVPVVPTAGARGKPGQLSGNGDV